MTSLSFPAPVPASILSELETRRREANRRLGLCRSGCGEVDDYVLLGGLERGSVVGISCEDERFGVTFAVQILARGLATHDGGISSAHVITPRPRNEILTALRDGIIAQLRSDNVVRGKSGYDGDDLKAQARGRLERVMLSCVFDMEGVQEVIAGLNGAQQQQPRRDDDAADAAPAPAPAPLAEREIRDSQEDDDDDDDEEEEEQGARESESVDEAKAPLGPDIVIITHFGALMTGLFAHRSSSSAHEAAAELSSRLRHLTRPTSSSHGPLILLLNSTASSSQAAGSGEQNAGHERSGGSKSRKPLDPTLRSIFNPPLLPDYVQQQQGRMGAGAAAAALARRNKPTFGLVFSQSLDVHILCSRVPRTDADAEAATATLGVEVAAAPGDVSYATVVEVLQDELGAWPAAATVAASRDGDSGDGGRGHVQQQADRRRRKCREQRWGAVAVRDGKVVDAFEKDVTGFRENKEENTRQIRVVAGFGGPRV